jgi:hypothetical protein
LTKQGRHIKLTLRLGEVRRFGLVESIPEDGENLVPHVRCRPREVQLDRLRHEFLEVAL